MVSVREAHFNLADFNIDEWVMRYIDNAEEALLLRDLILYLDMLPTKSPDVHRALLERAREMVEILAPLNMDIETLQASLLFIAHDAGILSIETIEEKYGASLSKLVASVVTMEAIGALKVSPDSRTAEPQIDNIRKMLLAMVEDVRAVVVKLAERVALLREVKNADEETRVLLAREVVDIYGPLANRLGIGQLKWELEDISFRYLHPTVYKDIAKQLDGKRVDREVFIDKFVTQLQQRLDNDQIRAKVYGRPKHIYSIWRKMKGKDLKFDELFDVRAVRIVTERLQDCYGALGVVHTLWHHIPREFDDYVANPKPNGYQSIHTVVVGPEGKTVEIQIRTEAMHQDSELGVAAHWKYKEGSAGGKQSGYEEKINWLRKILLWQEDVAETGNLVDEVRSQVFEDRVYVFTPNGEVVDLPLGSTVLDFAYYIHSHVGHKCIGAKVDGRIVPFTYQVETGERIEIITSKHPNPKRDWLNPNLGYIKSSRSRSKIQHWFKQQDRDKNMVAGKELLEAELNRVSLHLKDAKVAVERFNMNSMDDMLAAIGGGDLRLNQVVNYIETSLRKTEVTEQEIVEELIKRSNPKPARKGKGQVEVNGVGNLLSHIASCCKPVPGDEIFGYITMGRGVSVHRSDCSQVKELMRAHPERSVEVVWGENYSGGYRIKVRVIAHDRSGLLRDVTTVLAAEKSNVMAMSSTSDEKNQTATVELELELYNLDGLSRILSKLGQVEGVTEARRL
ncbi:MULTISPECIES: GTP diphosphokinase [unclassified Shewanella]|uniref:GTP diphosphokinase n=1 Tax=unclassified Shewanella TaxID=196818 RepID=UPI000C8417CC|nr:MULTISPECIES: GTP diphosphokinase [unclassified Shewanella]MDO6620447.1 GTP diphosphokinase [Shewanella sp. 6_MG-2023]MDO6640110.1 GTP diphosphokinase [Shewanella sp. 5_MG-2023]MDO6679726.1 GTP diphosphokinase [Shewanella sp. 4_MG-2023]MDO6774954.1 GTP diphosphokinase [Shewanella sp. 3_MG-2023]PMG27003.1 GTP diphosphokinase [Shewanella sp. 10N.286.52.C2]